MVSNANILTASQNSQLFSIQKTSRALDVAQLRVSTGKRVNSALDNPQNFFASFSLSSKASSLNRVLDGIGQGITALQSAENARGTLSNLIDQAEAATQNAKQTLLDDQQDLGGIILADNPVIYFRLNETSGTVATNLGTAGAVLNGTYQGGFSLDSGALTFSLDNASASFDGSSGRVAIPNSNLVNTDPAGYPARTVELTFEASTLSGRQVLFEEGGTGNAIAVYLDDDRIYFAARDSGDFGPFDISAQVQANTVYQASFVFDSASSTFTGYLNGEVVGTGAVTKPMNSHGGAVALGRNAGGTYFHDGSNGGNGEYFDGKISDFALYNSVLSQSDLQDRYAATQLAEAKVFEQDVVKIFDQADLLVDDAAFQGINLLKSDNLITNFNTDGSSSLLTEGRDLTTSGLGFSTPDFVSFSNIDKTLNEFIDANSTLENFGSSLSSDLNLIQTRQSYTEQTVNTLEAGSDDLTLADQDEEAANLLALQLQQEIQLANLSLSFQGSNIADLLSRSILK